MHFCVKYTTYTTYSIKYVGVYIKPHFYLLWTPFSLCIYYWVKALDYLISGFINSSIMHIMMTSSNGNIFRVTGHLCGEFTGPGEIQAQRPVTRRFDVFFHLRLNKRFSKQPRGWWFETPAPGVHDVIVMWWTNNICCVRSSVDYSWSRYLLNSNTVISPNYHWNSQLASLNKETLPNNFASNKEVSYKSSYPSKIFMIDIS